MYTRTSSTRNGAGHIPSSASKSPNPRPFLTDAQDQNVDASFSMPPEWAPHSHTITAWPDSESIPGSGMLDAERAEVSAIANAIARFEPVTMYTRPRNVAEARATLSNGVDVRPLDSPSQLWVRDSGPIFVQNDSTGAGAGLSLGFNYWGDKLPSEGDEAVAAGVLSDLSVPCYRTGFIAEGGGIEIDGEGTLLATESCIINENRNPGLSKADIEEQFKQSFGITKTIWLRGIKGFDLTDYHVDAVARFLSPGKVILGRPPKTSEDVVIEAYEEAREVLAAATDAHGRRLEVVEIAEPDPKDLPGHHFDVTIASYVNYLVVNDGLIIPRFGVGKLDDDALDLFREHFPGRAVVQVDINVLPKSGGGIHCATQQVPLLEGVGLPSEAAEGS